MTRTMLRGLAAAAPLLALCACGAERSEGFAATLPPPPLSQAARAVGAIYQAASGYAPLYYGQRASRVGEFERAISTIGPRRVSRKPWMGKSSSPTVCVTVQR